MAGKQDVVVTGMGIISSLGLGVESFWKALVHGECGVRRIKKFPVDSDLFLCKIAGECEESDLSSWVPGDDPSLRDRYAKMAIPAMAMALEDAGLIPDDPFIRSADLYIGSAQVTGDALDSFLKNWFAGTMDEFPPDTYVRTDPHTVTTASARLFGFGGKVISLTASCMSGVAALMAAYERLNLGEGGIAVVVGADVLSQSIFLGQGLTGELSRRNDDPVHASRPFDQDQDGQVVGEGAAAFVIETEAHARMRGADIYGRIGPFACTTDATSFKYIDPEGPQMERVLKLVIDHLDSKRVDYVNAHGPCIKKLDIAESKAIRRSLGKNADNVPVTSIKGATGNPAAAGGVFQVASALLSIRDSVIPPTLNLDHPLPECNLDFVSRRPRKMDVETVLVSTHGGGGVNTALAVRR